MIRRGCNLRTDQCATEDGRQRSGGTLNCSLAKCIVFSSMKCTVCIRKELLEQWVGCLSFHGLGFYNVAFSKTQYQRGKMHSIAGSSVNISISKP